MANEFSIEKMGKSISQTAKKKPALFYGGIAGAIALGAYVLYKGGGRDDSGLYYYSEPTDALGSGEAGGLTEADILEMLADRDDFISDQFGMVYDDIYSGFDSIAGQIAGLVESQQRIDYSFPPNYPYIPNVPELDYFPVDTTAAASPQSSGMSGEFTQAVADIQRNENLFFSPSVLLGESQVVDMGGWSALDISWQEQGSIGTSKNLPVTKDQLIVYKPDGTVTVVDRADYTPSSSSSSSSKSSSSSSSSSSSKSSSSSSSSKSSSSSGGLAGTAGASVGTTVSAGSSSQNPSGGKWSYSPSKNTWTKVG